MDDQEQSAQDGPGETMFVPQVIFEAADEALGAIARALEEDSAWPLVNEDALRDALKVCRFLIYDEIPEARNG